MISKRIDKWLDTLILILAFTFASLRPTFFGTSYPVLPSIFGTGPILAACWALAAGLAGWMLVRSGQWRDYLRALGRNWFLLLFVLLTLVSIAWSLFPSLSFYSAVEVFFATLVGASLGLRLSTRRVLDAVFWLGVAVVFLCYAYIIVFPSDGTMPGYPYYGAWRGFFWHRNHMGSILALLQGIYLLRFFLGLRERNNVALLDAVFFGLSLALVVMSRSATGYILVILLDGLLLVGLVWLRLRKVLKPLHYYSIGSLVLVGAVLAFTNLDFVFGLFNRSASMTGRIPMWDYLLRHVVAERPWLGHGFGVLWRQEAFQVQVQQAVGWDFPVYIADNGFLDILLHLGIVGLAVFVLALIVMAVGILRHAFRQPSLLTFFPLLVFAYALVANISFSLFLELESFVWLMVVIGYFLSMSTRSHLQSSAEIGSGGGAATHPASMVASPRCRTRWWGAVLRQRRSCSDSPGLCRAN